jgi:hypothetical protein
VKRGLILILEAENSTYMMEIDVKKPMVVSISQISENLGLYIPV